MSEFPPARRTSSARRRPIHIAQTISVIVFTAALTACTSPGRSVVAQVPQQARLDGSSERSFFGDSLALSGKTLAVGAWGSDASAGAVYVFEWQEGSWHETDVLTAPEPAEGDRFGYSVSLRGDLLLIGAPNRGGALGSGPGAAFLFARGADGEWQLEQTLTGGDDDPNARFGSAVALGSDYLAVTAARAGQPTLQLFAEGAVGWTEVASLPLGEGAYEFSLTAEDDLLAVGMRFSRGVGGSEAVTGGVQTFVRQGGSWAEGPTPVRPEQAPDCFGCTVALHGDLLAVGAPDAREGTVYLYRLVQGGWQQAGQLEGGDGTDHFGSSLAVGAGLILVGAPGDDSTAENAGAAYQFLQVGGTWERVALFPSVLRESGANVGSAVAVEGGTFAVGASGVDGASGAVLTGSIQFVAGSNGN